MHVSFLQNKQLMVFWQSLTLIRIQTNNSQTVFSSYVICTFEHRRYSIKFLTLYVNVILNRMQATMMLQAAVQRIFFANFGQMDLAETESQNHHKYIKAIAHQFKFGVTDVELVFHQGSSSFLLQSAIDKSSADNKLRRLIYAMFMKQSLLEPSEENGKNIRKLFLKIRKDMVLKTISELILLINQLYQLLVQNMFRKCIQLFQKWEKTDKIDNNIQATYIKSRIYTGITMLKLKLNETKHIEKLFQKVFKLRQLSLTNSFTNNKQNYLKKTIYMKIKFVQILFEKQQFDKAHERLKEYQQIFNKDQQGFNYLKNVLYSRISGLKKTLRACYKDQAIKIANQSSQLITLPPTPRQKSRSIKNYKIERSKSKNDNIKKKSVYVDFNEPFYRIRRITSTNSMTKGQLQQVYKNVKELKDKKLVSADITNQLNRIRQSIINRGNVQLEMTKKRPTNRITSKSKSSIFPSKNDYRFTKLRQIHLLPTSNTIKFLYFNYSIPMMCTACLQENQTLTITLDGSYMKKIFMTNNQLQQFDSEWSCVKYLFRRYLRSDDIFREIDKYTKISNEDVNEDVIRNYYKIKFQNVDIVQILELKELIRTFIAFNYAKIKQENGFKSIFIRKYNWENIKTKIYLKEKLKSSTNIQQSLLSTPKFDELFRKFPPKMIGFQYTISRQYQIYRIVVYFKRQFFQNYINRITDQPLKQISFQVDIKMIMPERPSNSKASREQFKQYKSVQIPLSIFEKERGVYSKWISKYLLDILVNNHYNHFLTSYFLNLFTSKSSISFEQELVLEFQKKQKVFDYQFNRMFFRKTQNKKQAKIVINQIQVSYHTRVQNSKRRAKSKIIQKLSSMSGQDEMESIRDSCNYQQKRYSKSFGGKLYIMEVRFLHQKKKSNRQWQWAAYYYISHNNNKITHKFYINSNDEKLLQFQSQVFNNLSLKQKVCLLGQNLIFTNRGSYRSLCIRQPFTNVICSNSLNYLRMSKKRLGAISKYQLFRSCQYTRVIKNHHKFMILSVYHIHWTRQMMWQVQLQLNSGQIWITILSLNKVLGLFPKQNQEKNIANLLSSTENQWFGFWNQIFSEGASFRCDPYNAQNYLQIKSTEFKIQQRLAMIALDCSENKRYLDIRLIFPQSIAQYQGVQNNSLQKESIFKVRIYQDGSIFGLDITFKELQGIFKFENNGQFLVKGRKSYQILSKFIIQKLHLFGLETISESQQYSFA